MFINLVKTFKTEVSRLLDRKVAQYIPNSNHEYGYEPSFNILAQAMFPDDTLKEQRWQLAEAMDSNTKIFPDLNHSNLLHQVIQDNFFLYNEQCRQLGLVSIEAIQKVSVENVIAITGEEVSVVEAFLKQQDIKNPENPVVPLSNIKLSLVHK